MATACNSNVCVDVLNFINLNMQLQYLVVL